MPETNREIAERGKPIYQFDYLSRSDGVQCIADAPYWIQATWREIASVGAYIKMGEYARREHELFRRLARLEVYADDYCECEQGKACKYHEMWEAGEEPWR